MKKRKVKEHKPDRTYNEKFFDDMCEHYDVDSILFAQECMIYELVDFLMGDLERLRRLLIETREQVNALTVEKCAHAKLPYPMTTEDVWDDSFDDNPVMIRYLELFRGGMRNY